MLWVRQRPAAVGIFFPGSSLLLLAAAVSRDDGDCSILLGQKGKKKNLALCAFTNVLTCCSVLSKLHTMGEIISKSIAIITHY